MIKKNVRNLGEVNMKEEKTMRERVKYGLEKIIASLQADGGDVELVEITPDGIVKVKLTGA